MDPSSRRAFLVHYAHRLNALVDHVLDLVQSIPGSRMAVRYIRSSYQNDPVRSIIELGLVIFCLVYVLKGRFSTGNKPEVKLSEKEIDELVEEWQPEGLVADLDEIESWEIAKGEGDNKVVISGATGPKTKLTNGRVVTNLASLNFYNFMSLPSIRETAITTLRTYGVGPCGPPNFYGTQDVHMKTEADVAAHLGVPAVIIHAQAFSTASSVIPAFSKRGDIIVADRAVNYTLRKGIQLSRSTVFWYDHNDMEDLEDVLAQVVKTFAKKPLTRRFIITEALSENVGDLSDLPKLVQLKHRYKFRLILDETSSYGVLGSTGRGITELQHVDPNEVDMIIGSLSGPLCAGGGFCAGSKPVVDHQRISSNSYTFSAALPALLATTASETVRLISDSPEFGLQLRENIKALRGQLDPRSEWVRCSSAVENPVQLLVFKDNVIESRNMSEKDQIILMQEIIDEALANGVMITRLKAMPETQAANPKDYQWQPQPALKVCVTTGLSKKETEKAGIVIRHAITKMITKRK